MRSRLVSLAVAALMVGCGAASEPAAPGRWQRTDLTQLAPVSGGESIAARSFPLGVLDPLPPGTGRWEGRGALVRGLAQAPGSSVVWRLELGTAPALAFTPLGGPAGGKRRVLAGMSAGGERRVLFEAETRPAGMPAAARVELSLDEFAGREIDLILEALGPGDGPRIAWATPELSWRDGVSPAPAAAARPNILLIGLDAVRADAIGPRPGRASLTPALDALAAESEVWLDAYTCFNVTNPSFASIFTGLYGKHHGAYELSPPGLAAEHSTLAELLGSAGYRTAAVVSARFLGAPENGIAQGFARVRRPSQGTYAAEQAVSIALHQMTDRTEPFFLFLHLFDAHTPHTPPEPYASGRRPAAAPGMAPVAEWTTFREPGAVAFDDPRLGGARDLYHGEIAYLDREIGRLLDFMRSRRLLERTLVAVVADHGENLNEHGVTYRHGGLFESTTHVPMMIRRPGPPRPGRRIEGLVQTIDLFPTLLAAAGLPVPAQDGIDLDQLFTAGRQGRRAVFAEHSGGQGAMVRTAEYRYGTIGDTPFLPPGPYLFDLGADPLERENLAGRGLPEEAELRRILAAWLADARAPRQAGAALGEEEEKELRALGYLP